jgi:hypothetical protein
MAGHFEAIGVADWRAFRDHAFDHGEWRRRPDGSDTISCRDESGATIVVWTNAANEVVYLAPSFDAQSRIPAGEVGVYQNPEYPFSSVVSVNVLRAARCSTPSPPNWRTSTSCSMRWSLANPASLR